MSKATDSSEIVYITRTDKSNKRIHSTENCNHGPNRARPIERSKVEGHYEECEYCFGKPNRGFDNSANNYQCVECGTKRYVPSRGARCLYACDDCGEMTTHNEL